MELALDLLPHRIYSVEYLFSYTYFGVTYRGLVFGSSGKRIWEFSFEKKRKENDNFVALPDKKLM